MKRKLFVPDAFFAWWNPKLKDSVREYRRRWRSKKTTEWEEMDKDGAKGVNYFSLKEATLRKYNLPSPLVVHFEVERWNRERESATLTEEQKSYYEAVEDLCFQLYHAKKNDAPDYFNQIKDKYCLPVEKCREFSEKWAVWVYVLEHYNRSSNSLNILLDAINRVFPNWFESKHSVGNFKCKCEQNGIEATVIDKRCIKKAQNRISSFQYEFLKALFIQSSKNTARASHKKLEKACEDKGESPYSYPSVKLYFRKFEKNVELYRLRYGQGAAQKQLPYTSLEPAKHILTLVHMDGKTMPFWGKDFQRYTLFFIIDNHSQKIISYQVSKSENSELILNTLDDMIRNTGYFPNEILSDKHSFHRTSIATRLKEETEKMGVTWTVSMNAQYNSKAERNNQYLDEIWKDFEGYTGSINNKLSPEEYEHLAKSKNLKSEEEIKALAAYAIQTYNKTPLNSIDGLTPNEKYEQSEPLKAFKISEQERVRLLRPVSRYKVSRGQITIKIGVVKHEFQLPSHLIDQYNNATVEVAYEDLTQGIYIFDSKTGLAEAIEPKKKIHIAKADQTEEDKKRLHQQVGRLNGTRVKARKREAERLAEALKENPEAIELINSHVLPKDIRQLALQDMELRRELRDMGVNENLLPVRDPKPLIVPDNARAGKSKESPFMTKGNVIRKMTEDDIYGIQSEEL